MPNNSWRDLNLLFSLLGYARKQKVADLVEHTLFSVSKTAFGSISTVLQRLRFDTASLTTKNILIHIAVVFIKQPRKLSIHHVEIPIKTRRSYSRRYNFFE
jgi:branched-subunit amino acid permease